MMNRVTKLTLAALVSAGTLTLTAVGASAAIVCNNDGACWHTDKDYTFRPEFGLTIHPNDWKWKEGEKHMWREHKGRGYWQGDMWKEF